MPDILDRPIVDKGDMYDVVVAHVDEWEAAVIREWKAVTGNTLTPAAKGSWNHIRVRCISEERAEWGTTRNAIRSIKVGSHHEPDPGGGGWKGPLPSGRLIQVTDEPGIVNRSYSYWPQAWLGPDGTALVFATTNSGPVLYEVRLQVDPPAIRKIGPLAGYGGTGEGMYWFADGTLAVLDGPRLRRLKPFTGASELIFDHTAETASASGLRLWQAHSSEDGTVHSATVEKIVPDGAYPRLGTVVWRRGEVYWWPSQGALDESQIDASGDFVVIKEGDDNWLIDIPHGEVRVLADKDGALGHSDCGHGFMVGEDNQAGACVRVDLRTLERRELFRTWGMGHVSVQGDRVLVSNATTKALELIDLRAGWTKTLLAALPNWEPGNYDSQVRASLSPCGKLASFVSNNTLSLLVL